MMISAPDQGVIRGSWTWSLDQVLEINPTFSLLISTLYFKLFNLDSTSFLSLHLLCFWSSSHCRSVRRACLIMTVISYHQINSHNALFYIETRPQLFFGPLIIQKSQASRKTHVDLGGRPLVSGSASTCLILWCSILSYDYGFSPLQHITHRQSVWQHTWHVAIGVKTFEWYIVVVYYYIFRVKVSPTILPVL